MKIGKGYLILIFGLVLILLNFMLRIKQDNPKREINNEVVNQQNTTPTEMSLSTQESPAAELPPLKPGITLLTVKNEQLDTPKVIKEEKASQRKESVSSRPAQPAGEASGQEATFSPAGITASDPKMPSKKELQEMNAKGIVIY